MDFWKTVLRLVLYTALAVLSALMIRQDAVTIVNGRKFGEISFTEGTQLTFILLSAILFFVAGRRHEALRPASYLVAGFLGVVLTRELDALFDLVYQGAWLPVALIVMGATLYSAYVHRRRLRGSIERFMATPAFGLFVAGGLGFFVFSRLFGQKGVWTGVFQIEQLDPRGPSRWVKNAVEEGTELFGYCLVLCAAIELVAYASRRLRSADDCH